ncbi:hypothetical protein D0Z00_002857 [Geotrichum galactomycetum]|uniref:Uncharacterized protein n=1 Tax=Geotrichum galactomycetum TaxID=27317 RepID=A0ACB6V2X0_9ASCO|nr:hypothetical protein D0Z00_002857 [Geotrichum candidum]
MAATTTSQSIKTNPSKQDTHVSQASKKAYTINNSVHKIYTDSRDNLSPAAIYNEKRKNGVFSMPSYPTVGVPTNSSANNADLSLKLWHHETSKTGLQAANLANSTNVSPDIWQPHKTPEASRAAILAKSKTVSPKQGRESISGSGKNASSAALSAHGVSGRDTAANALPDAYAWGDRTSSITPSSRGADLLGATHATSGSPVNARPGKSKSPSFTSISNTKVPDSNYLQNIGNLQEAARKKADDRLSKLYKSSSIANAGDGAAALAITTSREEELRKAQEREKSTLSVQQHEALMAVARGRAEKKISQIDEDVFYKNPTLNLKYYTAALAVAEEKGKDRMVNHGKIDIGGGKFMSQSDIDAIAERNVRPVINEISEKAQAQRQADEERRQAEEEEKRKRAEEKRLEQEQKIADRKAASDRKAADKAIKNEEKAKSKAEWEAIKTEEREKKAAEKAARDKERNEQKVFLEQKRSEEREAKVLQKSKLKEEKRVFAANRRTEKLALKTAVATTAAAVAQAKQAESLAHAEVQKLNALKLTAETKLEAARLAESHAESEAQAEKARADAALAEAEIAKADAQAKEAEARRIEAEAEKARANAEAEKAKENQRVGEEEAKKQELEFDQREAEINKQTSAKSAQDGEVKPDAELEASTNEVEEKAEKPEDDSEVVANNVVTPLVVVPDVNPPVETETSDKPISIADSVEKKSASDAAPVNTGIDSLAGLAPVIKTVETDATPAKPSEDATAVDTTLAPTDADEPTAEPTAEAAVATSPAESEEKNESLLKKPPTESKNTTSSVVSIKSGAPGTLETPGTNGDVAVTPIAENKDAEHAAAAAADGIPKAIETKAVETKPAEVTPPTSPTGDSIASPSSPTSSTSPKGKAKSFFSKVKSKAKEEFSSLKSSSKKTTTKSSTTTTAAPAAVAPAITEPEKKTGISSKTDASHGGVSAASAARAALGQPTEAAESSAVKTTSSKPPLERTFSGFSQGSAEDEVVETPTAEYKDALANAEDAAAETGSNAEGNKFFFSEDVDSIKGDGAPTSNN